MGLAAALLFSMLAATGCDRSCVPDGTPPVRDPAERVAVVPGVGSTMRLPPPREPGPPRPELPTAIAAATREAETLIAALQRGGVPAREAASVADMRGYRLYRRRFFSQALAWFRAGAAADSSYELPHYNAARCAALLGDAAAAHRSLAVLRQLDTPLARARLALARTDPDLVGLAPARATPGP